MRAVTLKLPQTKDDIVLLQGGMDQMTPTLKLHPGAARRSLNFEAAINGGYTRISGYERYDGRTSPSSMTFKLLPIVSFFNTPTIGQTVRGATSGTTAQIIAIGSNYVAVTKTLGPGFAEGEILSVSGTVVGAIGPQTVVLSKTLKKQYLNLTADVYRALISAVPGQGPVRGVFGAVFNGVFELYAFRDKTIPQLADALRCVLNRATPTGWFNYGNNGDLGQELFFFNGGPVAIQEGAQYDYFGTTATVKRVLLGAGSWEANTASGFLILETSPVDSQQVFHPVQGPSYTIGSTTFTVVFPSGVIQFDPGGVFEFESANFGGQQLTTRVYGCDRTNRCFEFDGAILAPIATGVETLGYSYSSQRYLTLRDRPTHIKEHHKHLFVGLGSSMIHSGPGTPYNFSAGAGAGETATGDEVTGFQILPGVQASGALAVFSRNHTKVLYGTALAGPEPFDLVNFQTETGALPSTIQTLDRVYYLDDRGVIDLKTAQDYGNFTTATLTRLIQKHIEQKHGRAVCSMIHRAKGQYRLFFNDGTALYITLDNGKARGVMPVAFPTPIGCVWSGEDNVGQEFAFAGGTDGFVYQLDRGTSFDGAAIDFELLLNWNTMRSPRQRKTIHKASIEIQDTDYTELRAGARLGPEISAHLQDVFTIVPTENELAMQWDHFDWDDFWWDAHNDAPLELDVKGTAERVQYILGGSSDYLDPFTISSIITHYIPRRGLR